MAKMLRNSKLNTANFGCCDMCARKKAKQLKPGPRERHVTRQREKRQWKKDQTN